MQENDNSLNDAHDSDAPERLWRPLNMRQRRVVGVLVEKAKTTPDAYPMTLNAIANACNQKSNRSPQMNLDPDDVLLVLDELREIGAVIEVHSGGRVAKYKHCMYEWLGVDKYEIAVMTELLLRGEQSLGELRGRAARMEPIADLGALKPIVESLLTKELMVELTPAGRGQVITHNLYEEPELRRLRDSHAGGAPPVASRPVPSSSGASAATPAQRDELTALVAALRQEVDDLKARVAKIESDLS